MNVYLPFPWGGLHPKWMGGSALAVLYTLRSLALFFLRALEGKP